MTLVDDNGNQIPVPERVACAAWWLVTEAAQVVQDVEATFKLTINLGKGTAPIKTVIERHQVLPG
jgi:hypothetical protein